MVEEESKGAQIAADAAKAAVEMPPAPATATEKVATVAQAAEIATSVQKAETSKAITVGDNWWRGVLAVIVVTQFTALVAYLAYIQKPMPDSQLILGGELTFVSMVLGYFFGSSSGSTVKNV